MVLPDESLYFWKKKRIIFCDINERQRKWKWNVKTDIFLKSIKQPPVYKETSYLFTTEMATVEEEQVRVKEEPMEAMEVTSLK